MRAVSAVCLRRGTCDGLTIVVEDDGVGFDVEHAREKGRGGGSLGLFSVEERLRLVGGAMEIDSRPGRGTRIVLQAPHDIDAAAVEKSTPAAKMLTVRGQQVETNG